ncbi:MAG: hypothetical protein ATN35_02880 [Epulopiscium sp. Nele67-Bin004]|nr:MAG: hypothetical protein ATN35_02880 [Epulopiscium sp. Nele67-Bin004]
MDEEINKSKPAYKFCIDNGLTPVISSITIERLNRAGAKLLAENPDLPIDTGYKVFSLQPKRKIVENNGVLDVANTGAYTSSDKLYNLLCASSQPLTSAIETIEPDKLYKINDVKIYSQSERKDTEPDKLCKISDAFYVLDNFDTPIAELNGQKIFIDGYSPLSLQNALNLGIVDNGDVSVVY